MMKGKLIFVFFSVIIIVILLVLLFMFFPKTVILGENTINSNNVYNDVNVTDNMVYNKIEDYDGNYVTPEVIEKLTNDISSENIIEEDEIINQDLNIIVKDKKKVSVNIKTGTLTVDGAVIVIIDKNINKYNWDKDYKLQQKVDGIWKDMEIRKNDNENLSEIVSETEIMEQSLNWSEKYGQVGVGQFRIVKQADGTEFYAEFEVK